MEKDSRTFVHKIDSRDRIIFVNEDWLSFARENGAARLSLQSLEDRPLWQFIADPETQKSYQALLWRVRNSGTSYKVHYRCDSPDCRRFMEMELLPTLGKSVEFRNHIIKIERRRRISLLDHLIRRSRKTLEMCGGCKKILVENFGWLEVELAIERLGLLSQSEMPIINQKLCPTCKQELLMPRI